MVAIVLVEVFFGGCFSSSGRLVVPPLILSPYGQRIS